MGTNPTEEVLLSDRQKQVVLEALVFASEGLRVDGAEWTRGLWQEMDDVAEYVEATLHPPTKSIPGSECALCRERGDAYDRGEADGE